MHRLFLVATLLGFVAPAVAQPDSYEAEVVYALTGLSGSEALLAGAAPDSLRPFVPFGAEVIATVDRPGPFGSRTVTVLARLAQSAEEAQAAYTDPEVPGWALRPRFDRSANPLGQVGFATSQDAYGPRSYTYDAEAGPPSTVSIRFRPRAAGGAFAEVEYRRLYPLEFGSRARAQPQRETLEAALPLLTPPPGGRQRPEGGGNSTDDYTGKALLESDLSPVEVAAHYGALLGGGGWTPGGAATDGDIATSVWTREHDGRSLAAMFYAHRTRPGIYALRVHLIATDR